MIITTAYGDFNIENNSNNDGIVAVHEDTNVQYFINGPWVPNENHTHDINRIASLIEDEYEFQHDIINQ